MDRKLMTQMRQAWLLLSSKKTNKENDDFDYQLQPVSDLDINDGEQILPSTSTLSENIYQNSPKIPHQIQLNSQIYASHLKLHISTSTCLTKY